MGARPQHVPAYRRMCRLLRQWREAASLTQRALAERLAKPHSYVHKVEIADRRIDPLEFAAWCHACDRSPIDGLAEVLAEERLPSRANASRRR